MSYKESTLDERVTLFMNIQQTLCDQLGLAFAVEHGAPFILYDVFGRQKIEVDPKEVTRVEHNNGETHITREERNSSPDSGSDNDKNSGSWFMDRFMKVT